MHRLCSIRAGHQRVRGCYHKPEGAPPLITFCVTADIDAPCSQGRRRELRGHRGTVQGHQAVCTHLTGALRLWRRVWSVGCCCREGCTSAAATHEMRWYRWEGQGVRRGAGIWQGGRARRRPNVHGCGGGPTVCCIGQSVDLPGQPLQSNFE